MELTCHDESKIWRFIYNKKIKEKSKDHIDSHFFSSFCEENNVNFGPDKAYQYYMNVMIGDLYKEPGLEPYEILELYKALRIRMTIHQLETLEKYCTVFLKLNSQRILVDWTLPRYKAVTRAYEPPVTDSQLERHISNGDWDSYRDSLGNTEGGSTQNQNPVVEEPEQAIVEDSGDSGEEAQKNPSENHSQDAEDQYLVVLDSEEPVRNLESRDSGENMPSEIATNSEHSRNLAITGSQLNSEEGNQNPAPDSEDFVRSSEDVTIIRMEPEGVEAEDVEIVGEIQRSQEDSDEDGDVTIENVITGDVEIPKDVEEKMWDYVGKNFEKDRPSRFLTINMWRVFKMEQLGETELQSGQLINHFTRNMLPKLWNQPIAIETRLQILKATRMPITDEQQSSLEKEFQLEIQVNQLSAVEGWSRSSESTPRTPKARIHAPSDSEVTPQRTKKRKIVMSSGSENESPTTTPKASKTSRTPPKAIVCLRSDSEDDASQKTPKTSALQKPAHSIGKKPTPNPRTGKIRRSMYTPSDDKSMWEFLLEEVRSGFEVKPKGLEIWKRYIDKTDCWREPANLASHYQRYMTTKLHLADIPLEDKLKLYMQCEITCPSSMIREFRKEYLINHQDMIITFAKKRVDRGFDDEEDEDDDVESPEAPEDEQPRRSGRVSRKPAKLEDF